LIKDINVNNLDKIMKCEYLEFIIKETLRLHSPAPNVFQRVDIKDHKLHNLFIKKDQIISWSILALG
jgi:cytochrome P450